MSKPSSHDNSLSNSSHIDESEVPTEQRAIALLPKAYPFEFTEEYQAAFGSSDAALVLPSSYRLAYWQTNVRDPHWQRDQERAVDYNSAAEEVYAERVARFADSNRLAQKRYDEELAEYHLKHTKYTSDVKAHQDKVARERDRMAEFVKEHARHTLKWEIRRQSTKVREAIEHVCTLLIKESREDDDLRNSKKALFFGALTLPTPFFWVSSITAVIAYVTRESERDTYRLKFVNELNGYTTYLNRREKVARDVGIGDLYKFFLYEDAPRTTKGIYSTVYFPPTYSRTKYPPAFEERYPLGNYDSKAFNPPSTFFSGLKFFAGFLLSAVPILGALWNCMWFDAIENELNLIRATKIDIDAIEKYRQEELGKLLEEELNHSDVIDYLIEQHRDEMKTFEEPKEPVRPSEPTPSPLPRKPTLKTAVPLEPPPELFDTPEKGLVEHVFKGSQVYGREQVMTLARSRLFANDEVHPHFTFGGVPFPIMGNSPHMLVIGTTGSGKTTTLLRLMSSLLPLSTAQAHRIAERLANGATAYPESLHQWGRSRTHQAVVYNAKGEYLQYLEAFGFDNEVDLFNFDPADPNGYAWDVAADIDTRESIKKFAEQLIPKSVAASQDKQAEFWNSTARAVVEAIIVSLRNAARHAGKEPSWTLRDLVKIGRNDDYIKLVLRWHDTPLEVIEEFFGLQAQQTSSVMLTLRQCMREYDLVAECWYHAKSRGRAISLKKWSLEGGQSVLVLPDTMENVSSYGPLNKAVMKALAGIWLKDRYSFYIDENGNQQKRHRFLIIDEFGEAGQFDELKRIMSQGRTFGIHVVLGLHQLSQVREAYGENGSETIIGLCPYKACMKSEDTRTQKWMSELIGNCLRSYEKNSFTYSTSDGVTITQSTNESEGGSTGTNESTSNSSTKGTSDTAGSSETHTDSKHKSSTSPPRRGEWGTSTSGTGESDSQATNRSHTANESTTEGNTAGKSEQTNWSTSTGQSEAVNKTVNKGVSATRELRGEAAIEPHEFGRFPDPETSGECEGVYITPTLPVFRTKLRMAHVQPEFEYPEKLNQTSIQRSPQEDEMVSRPKEWTDHDLVRLFLDKPHTLPEIPHMLKPPINLPIVKQLRSRGDEQPLLEPLDDHEPPLADFEF